MCRRNHYNLMPAPKMKILPFVVVALRSSSVIAESSWDELKSDLILGELKDGGFDEWMAECCEPISDGWSNSCITGQLPCNTGTGIIFGKSNYQFIDKPQTKDAGGQCMVFGSNCAHKNCVWPYDRTQEDELFAGNSTNPYPELLNLPSKVLFPQTAGDIVKAVDFATDNKIQVKVKSTGHSSFGDSTGADALLINMRSMPKYADPDADGGPTSIVECGDALGGFDDIVCKLAVARGMKAFAKVGGGQIFDELLRTINIWNDDSNNVNKYHVLSGASGTVGTSGGWLQGGGLGLTQNGRTFGFGIDHVLAYEMVLPDGNHVRFGPTEWEDSDGYLQPKTTKVGGLCNTNPYESDESLWIWEECDLSDKVSFEDLWFATRGAGGGGWGIVTAVFYQLQDQPGDLDVTMFGPFSESVTQALTPVWVAFQLDFFSDPDSLPNVTVEQSNLCGSYITRHTFVTLKQSTFFCFNGAGSVVTDAWKAYVIDRTNELLAAGMTQEQIEVASENSRIVTVPTYPSFAGNLPPEFIMLQNVETPPGRVADLNPTVMVNREGQGPNGMNMFQVPKTVIKEKKAEVAALITKIALSGKSEVYQMGGNHLIAQDQMNAMPQASREAAFLLEVPNYDDQETLLQIIFGDTAGEGGAFPGLYCHNIAMPNDYGPLKSDWTKPCPFEWSKEEKLDKCISFQEAVWGTELLARLEAIQSDLDVDSLFIQGYGVNGAGPLVGLSAANEHAEEPVGAPEVEEQLDSSGGDSVPAGPLMIDQTSDLPSAEDPVPVGPTVQTSSDTPAVDSPTSAIGRTRPLPCVSMFFFLVLVVLG